MQRLHNHAFYLYGVIVGLAIREAFVRCEGIFIPHQLPRWQALLEADRLVIFMMTISCFYFGAGVFFDTVYLNPEKSAEFQKKSYGLDFVFGLVHFAAFFGWAITINSFSRTAWGMSPFLGFLGAIFLYDVVWLLANLFLDTVQAIKVWAIWAAVVSVAATIVFFLCQQITHNEVVSEECAFVAYGLYLIFDAIELFSGRPFFLELMKRCLPRSVFRNP